jgi:hypothetical protein
LDYEFAAEEWCDCLTDKLADSQRIPQLEKVIYDEFLSRFQKSYPTPDQRIIGPTP